MHLYCVVLFILLRVSVKIVLRPGPDLFNVIWHKHAVVVNIFLFSFCPPKDESTIYIASTENDSFLSLISLKVSVDVKHHVYY